MLKNNIKIIDSFFSYKTSISFVAENSKMMELIDWT